MQMDKDVLGHITRLTKFYFYKFRTGKPYEDIYQDVVLSILETKYLDRYDGSRPIHNYLSGFVYNHFCKVYKVANYAVNKACSLFKEIDSAENICLMDIIPDKDEEGQEATLFIDQIEDLLSNVYGFSSFVVYDQNLHLVGIFSANRISEFERLDDPFVVFKRSPSTVFRFIYMGLPQTEIKDLLFVSKSWVSKIVKRISDIPELRELALDKGFITEDRN